MPDWSPDEELAGLDELAALRRKAERIAHLEAEGAAPPDDPDRRIIHELQVHQIELEMQVEELRRARGELEEAEERYHDLFHFLPVPTLVLDHQLVVVDANAAAIDRFGSGVPARVVGKPAVLFIDGEHHTELHRAVAAAITGTTRALEVLVRGRGGVAFEARLDVGPASAAGRHRSVARVLCAVTDLSARASLMRFLAESERMEAVAQLSGGIAHDFNNLLSVVIGNLELAIAEEGDDAPVDATLVREALAASQRGAQIISQLVAFARRQQLHPEVVDLGAAIEGAASMVDRTLGEGRMLDIAPAGGLPPVLVDRASFDSALINLAANSRDAMPRGGRMRIEVEALGADVAPPHPLVAGEHVVVRCRDDGAGMTEEVRRRVFEPFFTTKPPGAGSGLGLPMVLGFVTQSGGAVTVDSDLGSGTTVSMWFPVAGVAASRRPAPPLTLPEGPAPSVRVLLVEDDDTVRALVTRQLARLGHEVTAVAHATAALDRMRSGEIDLVVSDVTMPGPLDGWGLATRLAADHPGVRVLLTSGDPAAVASTPDGPELLPKPFTVAALDAAVRRALVG